MFEDVEDATDALVLAQDAANRLGGPVYIVVHIALGGARVLRIAQEHRGDYLEKVTPVR